jgi:hypothetical protein
MFFKYQLNCPNFELIIFNYNHFALYLFKVVSLAINNSTFTHNLLTSNLIYFLDSIFCKTLRITNYFFTLIRDYLKFIF